MEGYGYGNARLRAMRSRLLAQADYVDLLAQSQVEELITRLTETPYKEDIEAALVRFGGTRCVSEAVSANFTRTLRHIREFFEGQARGLLDILLRRWDRHNLLTILRGQSQGVSSQTVLSAVVPVGQLDEVALREMARQPGIRAVIDLMTAWHLPYAAALRGVRARTGTTPDLDQLELALNRYHYASIRESLSQANGNRAVMLDHVQVEIDLDNLRTALRLAYHPELVAPIRQRYHAASVEPLFVEPGGALAGRDLARLVEGGGGLVDLVRGLAHTRYGDALRLGWERYQATKGTPAVLERELERWQARCMAALFSRDPLGIGIAIGYLGCKEVEVANLRLIAQAVALNMERELVRGDLIIL